MHYCAGSYHKYIPVEQVLTFPDIWISITYHFYIAFQIQWKISYSKINWPSDDILSLLTDFWLKYVPTHVLVHSTGKKTSTVVNNLFGGFVFQWSFNEARSRGLYHLHVAKLISGQSCVYSESKDLILIIICEGSDI